MSPAGQADIVGAGVVGLAVHAQPVQVYDWADGSMLPCATYTCVETAQALADRWAAREGPAGYSDLAASPDGDGLVTI